MAITTMYNDKGVGKPGCEYEFPSYSCKRAGLGDARNWVTLGSVIGARPRVPCENDPFASFVPSDPTSASFPVMTGASVTDFEQS